VINKRNLCFDKMNFRQQTMVFEHIHRALYFVEYFISPV